MEDLLFAVNATASVVLTVLVGYFIKKIGLIDASVAKVLNKLTFRVFLPAMLFLNMYKIESLAEVDFTFVWYALGITLVIFLVAIPSVMLMTKDKPKRGAMLQAFFRANYALVGIPLANELAPGEGTIMATVLSAFIVPVFNILAVVGLSLFSNDKKPSLKGILLGIVRNPLIQSIALGFLALGVRAIFVEADVAFRLTDIQPVYKTLTSLSQVATPLALVALGAQFELSAMPDLKRYISAGVVIRNLAVPLIGIGGALLLGCFGKEHFAPFIAVFCTPVAVSSVPMAQEMDADVRLAGQLVVWTTLFSVMSIFLSSYILKALGIF